MTEPKLFPSYRIGLVMTRAGLNEAQTVLFKKHLRLVPKVAQEYVLVVPVVELHGRGYTGPHAVEVMEGLLAWLQGVTRWRVELLAVEHVEQLVLQMRELDEVWCATAHNQPGEKQSRPARVYKMAQALKEAPRFKLLHHWVALPPDLLPGTDARPKKKPKALKGW